MEKLLKKRRSDPDGLIDDDTHDAILRDGQAITVPLAMMDGMQRDVAEGNALHKPGGGNPPAEATERREQASVEYDRRLSEAWRQGKSAEPAPSNDVEQAYAQYDDRVSNAWKCGKA